jgi:ribonucleotide reductase class II
MEIILNDNLCNLSEIHLNNLDPWNFEEQAEAFKAGGIAASVLLHHKFEEPRYQYSREVDPIVAVSFTGLFDFFVKAFGADWLRWWEAGRPSEFFTDTLDSFQTIANIALRFEVIQKVEINDFTTWNIAQIYKEIEKAYLAFWKEIAFNAVSEYCDRNGLKRPNRCTALQPAGSKSLLTGASSGFAPPKAARYIRRITFAKDDAIALALMDYGYSVVPSQSDKDENGLLLNDPFDSRCTEWLVEIPFATSWADLPGCDQIDISKFSIEAQFDFMMQVQKHYVTHNISSTLEIRENEIETLAKLIYNAIQNDEGYISSAVLARFDSLETFPRLPFEPISKEVYQKLSQDVLSRRKNDDFLELLSQYDNKEVSAFDQGAAACDSDKCLLPLVAPNKTKESFENKGFETIRDSEEENLLDEEARKRLESLL